MEEVFKLTQNCIPVRGANRSVICDLHRNTYDIIPNDLYDILVSHEEKTLNDLKAHFENKYDNIIDEYFEFLLEHEYVFFTNTPEWFPKLSREWSYPFEVSNAIIDINENSQFDIYEVLEQLEKINCKHVEFRFYDFISLDDIKNIILFLDKMESIISSIGIAIPYNLDKTKSDYLEVIKTLPRVSYLIVYSAEIREFVQPLRGKTGYVIFTEAKIENEKCCGIIDSSYFISNIKIFTESLKHNSCLNRKISVSVNGEIKNCPSMFQSFGNIKDTSLKYALAHKDFKKYWNVTKDQIEVCKDCEFRYICTDCRAYKENPEDDYSKPLKCGYNPYTNAWEEWSTNPIKQQAVAYYGMQNLVKND